MKKIKKRSLQDQQLQAENRVSYINMMAGVLIAVFGISITLWTIDVKDSQGSLWAPIPFGWGLTIIGILTLLILGLAKFLSEIIMWRAFCSIHSTELLYGWKITDFGITRFPKELLLRGLDLSPYSLQHMNAEKAAQRLINELQLGTITAEDANSRMFNTSHEKSDLLTGKEFHELLELGIRKPADRMFLHKIELRAALYAEHTADYPDETSFFARILIENLRSGNISAEAANARIYRDREDPEYDREQFTIAGIPANQVFEKIYLPQYIKSINH